MTIQRIFFNTNYHELATNFFKRIGHKLSIIPKSETFVDFVFFDVEVLAGLNDKNVFIPFFPALGRFIKHRVSDHLQTTLFIRLIVFISEAVFFLLVLKSYNPVCGLSHRRSSYVSNAVTAQYLEYEQGERHHSYAW